LGTAAGLLLGGLGGRKYAKRSKSEEGRRRRDDDYDDDEYERRDERGHRGHGVRRHGWDKESATYKSGTAIR
jgi:hypothetical protein